MAVEMMQEAEGRTLRIHVTGKLVKEDYARLVPEFECLIGLHGKLRVLLEMVDFHGWTAGALWQDIKFDLKHFRDIERVALVGEKRWQKGMAAFCQPFTAAEVRYFDRGQSDQARAWIDEGVHAIPQ
jgi:hypothetical protein